MWDLQGTEGRNLQPIRRIQLCAYMWLNSRSRHATYAVRDWRESNVEDADVGMQSQACVDSEFVPVNHNEYAGGHIGENTLSFISIKINIGC